MILSKIKAGAIGQVAIVAALCLLLLTGCDLSNKNVSAQASNSPAQVQSLTRIAHPGEGVSVTTQPIEMRKGQIVFVPAYSHIYFGDRQDQFALTVTLSIRNTSLTDAIELRSVRYYNSDGKLVKEHTEGNLKLAPLATAEFFIPQQDTTGGSGANFIVEWVAAQTTVTSPLIEAVMISTSFQQGVSFTSSGRVLQELKPQA